MVGFEVVSIALGAAAVMKFRADDVGKENESRAGGATSLAKVDVSEHLKVMMELAECKEKYYRLGADMRLLKQRGVVAVDAVDELKQARGRLQSGVEREERLRHEFAQFRHAAAAHEAKQDARIDTLQASLAAARARVDELETSRGSWERQRERTSESQAALVDELHASVRDLKYAMGILTDENDDLHRQLQHARALRDDTSKHCEHLTDVVRELRQEIAAVTSDTSLSDAMAQMLLDNRRLIQLLGDTKEYTQFKMYTTLDHTSHCSPESFRRHAAAPPPPSSSRHLMAWGRLIDELRDAYPTPAPTGLLGDVINFAVEEKQWVPTKILHWVNAFRAEYCKACPPAVFCQLVHKMNGAWQQRCAAKVKAVHDSHRKLQGELRRQAQQAVPYDAIVHTREIARLRQEVAHLTRKKLQGKPKKVAARHDVDGMDDDDDDRGGGIDAVD
ncbi:Aste57867_13071 [Aphanomyces stellatus]|uniref:Aste57867_13071 protein n=1 Tax=Aphanomyces stellatus TaxID=120398 RepID=A0A485KXI4_9STRA|nr:hypothetical protein As57867_013023 [Aphanomyces stellatus]VFT89915.1 Aste57867_13071 [Aphanomyces stellatus]